MLGGVESFFKQGERVAIKPNLCNYKYSYPATSSIQTMKVIIEVVRQFTDKIFVIESPSATMSTPRKYRALGYDQLEGVTLIDLNKNPLVKGVDFDKLINLCNLKTSEIGVASCGMKNIFGCYPNRNKAKFHSDIENALVEINRRYSSDLVIVDAFLGMEGEGPIYGNPILMNLLVAGDNVVAADYVGCQLMSINPICVPYLLLASVKGLGNIDEIKVLGETIETARRKFRMASPETLKHKVKHFICSFDFAMRWLAKLKRS